MGDIDMLYIFGSKPLYISVFTIPRHQDSVLLKRQIFCSTIR